LDDVTENPISSHFYICQCRLATEPIVPITPVLPDNTGGGFTIQRFEVMGTKATFTPSSRCYDDASFYHEHAFLTYHCHDWAGFDCVVDGKEWGLTSFNIQRLVQACPEACGLVADDCNTPSPPPPPYAALVANNIDMAALYFYNIQTLWAQIILTKRVDNNFVGYAITMRIGPLVTSQITYSRVMTAPVQGEYNLGCLPETELASAFDDEVLEYQATESTLSVRRKSLLMRLSSNKLTLTDKRHFTSSVIGSKALTFDLEVGDLIPTRSTQEGFAGLAVLRSTHGDAGYLRLIRARSSYFPLQEASSWSDFESDMVFIRPDGYKVDVWGHQPGERVAYGKGSLATALTHLPREPTSSLTSDDECPIIDSPDLNWQGRLPTKLIAAGDSNSVSVSVRKNGEVVFRHTSDRLGGRSTIAFMDV
jgi:hypothetical protein